MLVNPTGGGTTTPSVGGSPHNYADGTVVNLTANAATGYHFVDWSGDASGTSTTTSVTMNSDKTVTANFEEDEPITYNLYMLVNPTGGGTTTPSVGGSPHNYADGTVVNLTANAATGYHFVDWSGDASGSSTTTSVTMNSDKTVTANFEKDDPCLNNLAPVIGNIPRQAIERYHWYYYTVPASDPEFGDLFYELTDKPSGMTINSSTGTLVGGQAVGVVVILI